MRAKSENSDGAIESRCSVNRDRRDLGKNSRQRVLQQTSTECYLPKTKSASSRSNNVKTCYIFEII